MPEMIIVDGQGGSTGEHRRLSSPREQANASGRARGALLRAGVLAAAVAVLVPALWMVSAGARSRVAVVVLALLPLAWHALATWWRSRRHSFRYESRLQALIGSAVDPFLEYDVDGILRTWSPQAEAVLGWRAEEVLGQPVSALFPPSGQEEVREQLEHLASGDWTGLRSRREALVLDASGTERWTEITCWPSVIRGTARMSAFVHDITDRRRLEAQLRSEAENDSLTGLTNRRTFSRALAELCGRFGRSSQRPGAVVFLDLDRFQQINDTYGHHIGDRLLQTSAARIRSAVDSYPGAIPARFGGDEFAVLVPDVSRAEARMLAASLVARLQEPFSADGHEMPVSTSLGLVVLGTDRCRADDVMRDADLAMSAANEQGGTAWAEFEPSMYEAMSADTMLEAELRAALRAGSVEVHYQPVVALPHGRATAVEALARWNHPELGQIPPARFIPLAEQRGLISAVGSYVLQESCAQHARWRAQAGEDAPRSVSVNVSAEQLRDARFADQVETVLAAHGLRGADLTIEITEDVAMQDDPTLLDTLRRLSRLGVVLSVDDFGAGQSSLSRLRDLPVSALKIDPALLEGVTERGANPLMHAVVTLADTLKLTICVEGIETPEQAEYVSWLGCEYGQGYLYCPPLAPAELLEWWQRDPARPPARMPSQRGAAQDLTESAPDRTPRSE
jgi:diguanylate cyclase (GGDEF)-like protein/PAS domain S-box-containing protein